MSGLSAAMLGTHARAKLACGFGPLLRCSRSNGLTHLHDSTQRVSFVLVPAMSSPDRDPILLDDGCLVGDGMVHPEGRWRSW